MDFGDLANSVLSAIGEGGRFVVDKMGESRHKIDEAYDKLAERSDRDILRILKNPSSFPMRMAAMKIATERGLIEQEES